MSVEGPDDLCRDCGAALNWAEHCPLGCTETAPPESQPTDRDRLRRLVAAVRRVFPSPSMPWCSRDVRLDALQGPCIMSDRPRAEWCRGCTLRAELEAVEHETRGG